MPYKGNLQIVGDNLYDLLIDGGCSPITSNGPLVLLEVKRVRQQIHRSGYQLDIYVVDFGGAELYVTRNHAFRLRDGACMPSDELKPGDQIWVDVHAFLLDGSYRMKNKPVEKG